jgi:2-oxoglutarate ferredoxin oxidoreductase subunit beta
VITHAATAANPATAFALSRFDGPEMANVPMGIFRNVSRPTYDDRVRAQVAAASPDGPATDDELLALLHGGDTWAVAADT